MDEPYSPLSAEEEAVLREAGSLRPSRASVRTRAMFEQLINDGLTPAEAAARLGTNEAEIEQRIRARSLLGIHVDGQLRLPMFQFTQHGELPGVAELWPAFPSDAHPVAVWLFLNAASPELQIGGRDLSPAEWLGAGRPVAAVIRLAKDAYAAP